MTDEQLRKTHFSVWVVGVLSLIWHLMGCANYIWQAFMGDDSLAAMSPAQAAIIQDRPAWATGAFAVAVFAGAVGSVFLLLRKSVALVFFVVALLGVIVTMIPVFGIVTSGVEFSAFEKGMFLILTPLVGAFLVWYMRVALRVGWVGGGGAVV